MFIGLTIGSSVLLIRIAIAIDICNNIVVWTALDI